MARCPRLAPQEHAIRGCWSGPRLLTGHPRPRRSSMQNVDEHALPDPRIAAARILVVDDEGLESPLHEDTAEGTGGSDATTARQFLGHESRDRNAARRFITLSARAVEALLRQRDKSPEGKSVHNPRLPRHSSPCVNVWRSMRVAFPRAVLHDLGQHIEQENANTPRSRPCVKFSSILASFSSCSW